MAEPRKSKEWRLAMTVALAYVGNGRASYWMAIAEIVQKAHIEQTDAMRIMDAVVDMRERWMAAH